MISLNTARHGIPPVAKSKTGLPALGMGKEKVEMESVGELYSARGFETGRFKDRTSTV